MDLRPIDLRDDDLMSAAFVVECAASLAARPGWTPLGRDARVAGWRAADGWRRQLVGGFVDRRLVGFAAAMTADDTPATTWISVSIDPLDQRRGHGTALVRAAEELARDTATRFVASTYRPTVGLLGDLSDHFAAPLGYRSASTETVVELDLVRADLTTPAPGPSYVVETHLGGLPAHLLAEVGVIKGLVDVDAPSGDLAWEPTPVSPAEYAADLALWAEQGRTIVESVAVRADTGAVVAWTGLVVEPDPARAAEIEGTLVLAAHRGHGLGRAVKVASLLAARERTTAARVRTSSDDANTWMRRINSDLGFVPVESEVVLQKLVPAPRPPVADPR